MALWIGFAAVVTIRVGFNTSYLSRALLAPGPNTVGEAGKTYFAQKYQRGNVEFPTGQTPPFYPSIHGFLVHAPVGLIGRAMGASPTGLYWIGRAISLTLTLLALCVWLSLGRRMRIGWGPLMVGVALWLGTYSITQHTTSYRPDNWLLFLSLLSCWLVAREASGASTLILLAVIPTAAFHVKAPGLCLIAAICLASFVQGKVARGLGLAAAQVTLVFASIILIDAFSGDTLVAPMRHAGDVGLSLDNLLSSIADPLLFFLLLLPLALTALPRFRETLIRTPTLKVTAVFWMVTGICYGAAATRAGSSTYYFLEPASFALLVALAWLSLGSQVASSNKSQLAPYLLGVTLFALPDTVEYVSRGHPMDVALYQTTLVGEGRTEMARRLNADSAYCFTDDPGLNVLLDRPGIIHPLVLLQAMGAGTLPQGLLDDLLREHVYDCIVLSGVQWVYRGIYVMPESFYHLAEENYPNVERVGEYTVRRPERGGSEAGVPTQDSVRTEKPW